MICPLCRHFDRKIKLIPEDYPSQQPIDSPTGSFNNKLDQYELSCVRTDVKSQYSVVRSDGCFPEKQYLSTVGREGASAHPEPKRGKSPNDTWTI